MIDNELNPQESLISEGVKEELSRDGASLETQIRKCVDTLIIYQKQREEFLEVIRILHAKHNSTLRQILQQIGFPPNEGDSQVNLN